MEGNFNLFTLAKNSSVLTLEPVKEPVEAAATRLLYNRKGAETSHFARSTPDASAGTIIQPGFATISWPGSCTEIICRFLVWRMKTSGF